MRGKESREALILIGRAGQVNRGKIAGAIDLDATRPDATIGQGEGEFALQENPMMSNRERWVILYPLLTLAVCLGIKGEWHRHSMRRHLSVDEQGHVQVGALDAEEIHTGLLGARSVQVSTIDKKPCIEMGPAAHNKGGLILLYGPQGKGKPMAQFVGTESGGLVRLFPVKNAPILVLGHDGNARISGLLARNKTGQLLGQHPAQSQRPLWGPYYPWPPPPPENPDEATPPPAE